MSPSSSRLHLRQFVTTTVFADPTALGSHVDPHDSIPVAAIAGGVCGGVVLAVLAVIGWKWWGRQIKKRERRELEKRKAMAYRQRQARSSRSRSRSRTSSTRTDTSRASSHSPSGTRSRRTSSDSKAPSHRIVKFTGSPLTNSSVPPVPPLPPLESISSPRPLKPRSAPDSGIGTGTGTGTAFGIETAAAGSGSRNNGPPVGRPRTDSKSYRPLRRPSPLALGSPRTADLPSHRPAAAERSVDTPKTPAMAAQHVPSQPPPPPSSFTSTRLPRIKASLSSLTGEARRQPKASSHNSASDQSRHSSAGGSARRWSWWSLINGNGFRQVGPTTGKNRISADTSVLDSDWQEEDPSAPIGYACSGVDNDDDQRSRERTLANKNSYVFLDSSARGQDA
ncbi:hypothetical protein ACEPAI_4963 [Sanghuangporus weigelae]